MEYLNLLLLMDANALYFAERELRLRGADLLRVIKVVGEMDAAIAIASFRTGSKQWTRPSFVAPNGPAVFADLCHPLVSDAVPNSITLAPPHGVLVTGSNMSGKSTFLRTVGRVGGDWLREPAIAPATSVRRCSGRSCGD
jgi:DNA mismatch repair ATPase MutS